MKRVEKNSGAEHGLGGILHGLGELVERLGELSEKGQTLSGTGNLGDLSKEVKGIYGFTVKMGIGQDGPRIEPFGNIRKDRDANNSVVQEVREPAVDVFEEEDHVLVVAEMPGVGAEDVHIAVEDDLLTIAAERGDKKYRKEVILPAPCTREKIEIGCNNGVVEIKCRR